ncbi:coiled-coil domain-containing protein 22 homolog [Atheta coriaria]|uniref:coiled-coil domain-containing protein 22 homolog n=1 Tax=Dalotia coriaria TaxID=877792 RepID=UPI0031F38A0D
MEEVDNIIIDSLRNINCNIDEEVASLKSFSEDDVTLAIVSCLEIIIPNVKLPTKMPASMSARLKYTSQLVEHIKSLGFRGDIGYQSILYFNEIEIRRILMFLIERLPRENSKVAVTETIGYVPMLVKEIEDKVRLALCQTWIPPGLLQSGARIVNGLVLQQSFSNSIPLTCKHIEIPQTKNATEELKDYWVHCLPAVTQQCSKAQLIPSLLYNGDDLDFLDSRLKHYVQTKRDQLNPIDVEVQTMQPVIPVASVNLNKTVDTATQNENEVEIQIANTIKMIEAQKITFAQLQNDVKHVEAQLVQTRALKDQEDAVLKENLNTLKIKSRTLTVLSKEENMTKLKTLVENGNERLLDLANQWNEVQTPLIEQYRSLKTSVSQQELKQQEEQEKLKLLNEKVKQLDDELVSKEGLESVLLEEVAKINKTNSRNSYTKRIMEIIGNIKKQDCDIAKILKDTKDVQKEINTLSGQLDRSFTLSDALIFKDAKFDEVARRSYKLLATLHMDCEAIVQAVSDVGLMERECRNVEEQIDAESNREVATKLKRVMNDIEQLRNEGAK